MMGLLLQTIFHCLIIQAFGAGFEILENRITRIEVKPDGWCYKQELCREDMWYGWVNHNFCAPSDRKNSSPINIKPADMTHDAPPIEIMKSSLKIKEFTWENRAYSVSFVPKSSENISILWHHISNEPYHLHSFHLHWSAFDDVGSEHCLQLDGKSYPLELHLMFVSAEYKNSDDAVSSFAKGALLVVSAFLEGAHEQYDSSSSNILKIMVNRLSAAPESANDEFNLADLFLSERAYTYDGTLTTPPCTPATWLILSKPVIVPRSHLVEYRSGLIQGFQIEGNNFRSLKAVQHYGVQVHNVAIHYK